MGKSRNRERRFKSPTDSSVVEEEDLVRRKEGLLTAKQTPFLSHKDKRFWHGRLYTGPDDLPETTWVCNDPPRDDHKCPAWLTASEYQDLPDTLQAKCEQLAQLMRSSKRTVIYTGAGISASMVGQAARGGANEQGWKEGGGRKAKPTQTHFLLGHLARAGFIHEWVQQNHDGLPQKAGFPQEKINEVHGSWYDPSNPVVKYGGSLRDAEAAWMVDAAKTADLVIVLGTSLGGLNADQVATKAASRSLSSKSLGTVCINLQQTPEDGKMSLRLFGKSDEVLAKVCKCLRHDLARRLGLEEGQKLSLSSTAQLSDARVLVPYDAKGHRVHGTSAWMWLDLNVGKEVQITEDNNIQGCKQPAYKHIGSSCPIYGVERKDIVFSPGNLCMDITKKGLVSSVHKGSANDRGVKSQWIMRKIIVGGETQPFSSALLRHVVLEDTSNWTAVFDVPRLSAPLSGVVATRNNEECCFELSMTGATMHFGFWWLEAAARGALDVLPLTNTNPEFALAPTV